MEATIQGLVVWGLRLRDVHEVTIILNQKEKEWKLTCKFGICSSFTGVVGWAPSLHPLSQN